MKRASVVMALFAIVVFFVGAVVVFCIFVGLSTGAARMGFVGNQAQAVILAISLLASGAIWVSLEKRIMELARKLSLGPSKSGGND